jgi:hypothetical protein
VFRQIEIVLFLSLWLTYGLLINSDNLQSFNLQQMGVEAMAERGHFYLEGSTAPQLRPQGDTFSYRGHIYAAKQPGQFMAGAVVYYALHAFGLNYRSNYLLCSALVTFLTASLATAAAVVCVFRWAKDLAGEQSTLWPALTALTFGFATTALPYSGIAHHDALAADYLVIASYLVLGLSRQRAATRGDILRAGAAGLLLGLTVTTSMLSSLMAAVVVLWFISLRRWTLSPVFLLGCTLGLVPLLIYDWVSFGNPFLVPNFAGHYSDTYFHLDWNNFAGKLRFYSRSASQYIPTFCLGLIGLFCLARKCPREAILFISLIAVLAAYILNVDSVGTCMYGPRYLLPAMPFASLGLIGFAHLKSRRFRAAALATLVIAGLYSIAVNLVGAMHGAMYCSLDRFAVWPYWSAIANGRERSFPLLPWLIGPTIALCLFLLIRASRQTTAAKAAISSSPVRPS